MPSRLEMLEKADELVCQLAEAAGFDEDSRLDIRTAAHESLINAMVHGNRTDEARRVTLEVGLDSCSLEMRVRDEGQGFDPSLIPNPLAPENLCRPSGRGLLLMRALMDAVTFRRPPSGGMEVTMRKHLGRMAGSDRDPDAGAARA
jgi:serine/threonine-protein kinase RsbW